MSFASGISGARISPVSNSSASTRSQGTIDIEQVGLEKKRLRKIEEQFAKAGEATPSGLQKIIDKFDTYDRNDDGRLQLYELKNFSEKEELPIREGLQALFTKDEGLTQGQVHVLVKIAREEGQDTSRLRKLEENFNNYDQSGDGNISLKEFSRFAKRTGAQNYGTGEVEDFEAYAKRQISAIYEEDSSSLGEILTVA
ncbi:MAG: EF-hand domain-containing protein [Bdellovibrionales bacterium]|nr:EF-hand domain-containing protein [Bdellovibrionales bacterium]